MATNHQDAFGTITVQRIFFKYTKTNREKYDIIDTEKINEAAEKGSIWRLA